jgi:hypothetical protein
MAKIGLIAFNYCQEWVESMIGLVCPKTYYCIILGNWYNPLYRFNEPFPRPQQTSPF